MMDVLQLTSCILMLIRNQYVKSFLGRSICVGTIVTLDGTNSNPVSYTWSNGNNSSTISVSNQGNYELTIMDNGSGVRYCNNK